MRTPRRFVSGISNKLVIAIVAAAGIGATFPVKMLSSGTSDLAYILFVSLTGVIAMALVAPGLFSGRGDRPPWEHTRPQNGGTSTGDSDDEPDR